MKRKSPTGRKSKAKYRRVLLKVSGEGLAARGGSGIAGEALRYVAGQLRQVHAAGVQVAVVIGGGNICRGTLFAQKSQIPEATAHYMGMLATVINALALQEALEAVRVPVRVLSSLPIGSVCESFSRRRCLEHLDKGRVLILAGGTGRPFVTTDTAAAVAAVELGADALFKATQVDGVYSADPHKNPRAKFYRKISYDQVIAQRLAVMDISAVDICRQNNMPIVVFTLYTSGNMKRIIEGRRLGTVISS